MSEHPGPSPETPTHRGGTRWFWPAIIVMVAAFIIVVCQRGQIRSRWWAWQLTRSNDLTQQAHYLGLLIGAGDAGAGAVDSLARYPRAEVRALAVVALAKLRGERGIAGLRRLLTDEDADVAESAAVSLAFLKDQQGLGSLVEAVERGSPTAAAAALAALPRIASPVAMDTLCRTASDHAVARVRAQAVESLAAWLMAGGESENLPCDPVGVLVAALEDPGKFPGVLSLERQIASAELMTNRPIAREGSASPPAVPSCCSLRTVGEVAAGYLERLTGRKFEPAAGRTAADCAELAEQCRTWLRERGRIDSLESATQPAP
jgi:hypothetical protein